MADKDKSKAKMTASDEAYFKRVEDYAKQLKRERDLENPAFVKERVNKGSLAPYELKAQKFDRSMRGGGGGGGPGAREMQLGSDLDPKAMMRRMNEESDDSYKKGGKVSSASARADGIAQRGKTKGRIV
jgi:hypothetical protein